MNDRYVYTIKVAHQRAGRKFWSPIGTMFYNPPRDEYKESVALRLNSLPPVACECRAFPRHEDQAPADCPERFTLTVKIGGGDGGKPLYHAIGTAFYNAPSGEFSENFNILLDSYPLSGDVKGYPALTRDEESEPAAA